MARALRLFMTFIVLSAAAAQPASAADADIAYVVAYVEAMPPATPQALAALRELRKTARAENGNLRFEVLQRIGQPADFVILEAWRDKDALAAHGASEQTKRLRAQLDPLLRSPYDERPHGGLAVAPAPAGGAPRGAVYAVTHVDVVPTQKDVGIALVTQLSEGSRAHKGNVGFDALQQTSRPNHMTVVEVWTDAQAAENHGMDAATRQFRGKLQPLSGSLYDERFYRALD